MVWLIVGWCPASHCYAGTSLVGVFQGKAERPPGSQWTGRARELELGHIDPGGRVMLVTACEQPDGGAHPGSDEDPGVAIGDLQKKADDSQNDQDFKDGAWAHGGGFFDAWGFVSFGWRETGWSFCVAGPAASGPGCRSRGWKAADSGPAIG